jgi:hypothetical protein
VLPVFAGERTQLAAVFGSVPNAIFVAKLPTNAGWQPALSGIDASSV